MNNHADYVTEKAKKQAIKLKAQAKGKSSEDIVDKEETTGDTTSKKTKRKGVALKPKATEVTSIDKSLAEEDARQKAKEETLDKVATKRAKKKKEEEQKVDTAQVEEAVPETPAPKKAKLGKQGKGSKTSKAEQPVNETVEHHTKPVPKKKSNKKEEPEAVPEPTPKKAKRGVKLKEKPADKPTTSDAIKAFTKRINSVSSLNMDEYLDIESEGDKLKKALAAARKKGEIDGADQETLVDAIDEALSIADRKVEYSRGDGTSVERPLTSKEDIKAALSKDSKASLAPRLTLGEKGERGGVILVENQSQLPVTVTSVLGDGDVIQGAYDEATGLTYIVANNVTASNVEGVYLHEAFHGNPNDAAVAEATRLLADADNIDGDAGEFFRAVRDHMDERGELGNPDESVPYIVEHAVQLGHINGFSVIDGRFMDWVDANLPPVVGKILRDIVAKLRAWRLSKGADYTPTVDDMVALARRSARDLSKASQNDATVKFSRGTRPSITTAAKAKLDALKTRKGGIIPSIKQSDFGDKASGTVPLRSHKTLASVAVDAVRTLERKFVDRFEPVRRLDRTLHTKLEMGQALRNNLLATFSEQHMRPYVESITEAAKQLRKATAKNPALAAFKHLTPHELSNFVGEYAVLRYAAQANMARADMYLTMQDEAKARTTEILTDHPEFAIFAIKEVGDLSPDNKAILEQLLNIPNIAPDQEAVTLRPLVKSAIDMRGKAKLIAELAELEDTIDMTDREIQLYIQHDNVNMTQEELKESGYRPIGGFTTAMANVELDKIESSPLYPFIISSYGKLKDMQSAITEMGDRYGVYTDMDRLGRDGLDSYVPTTGDSTKLRSIEEVAQGQADLLDDLMRAMENEIQFGVGINNRNLFRKREGRTTPPDPADKSIIDRLYLMVNQIGAKQFKDEAVAKAIESLGEPQLAMDIRNGVADDKAVRKLLSAPHAPDAPVEAIEVGLDGPGKVVSDAEIRHMLTVTDSTGTTFRIPVLIRFNTPGVADALRNTTNSRTEGIMQPLGSLNRFHELLITALSPVFPVVAAARDINERVGNLSARSDLIDANGKPITVGTVYDLYPVWRNVVRRLPILTAKQRAENAVWQAAVHRNYLDTEDGQFLKEFSLGLKGSGLSTRAGMLSGALNDRSPVFNRMVGVQSSHK